jgi:hypothetical protein
MWINKCQARKEAHAPTLHLPVTCIVGSLFAWLAFPVMVAAGAPLKAPAAISARIEANYARLNSVQAVIESTLLSPNVKERTVVTNTTDNGVTTTIVMAPKSTHVYRLALRGRDLYRAEIVDGNERDYFVFRHGVWTQYSSRSKTAWLHLPEQMGGMFPLDPRDYGLDNVREHFLEGLRAATVLEAKNGTRADGAPFAQLLMERPNGRRWRVEFDSSRNYLPTTVDYLHGDGSLNVGIRITYRNVLKGPDAAWFPEVMTVKIFGLKGSESFDAAGANSILTERVKGEIRVNQPLPDDVFDKELPPGTQIYDSVNSAGRIAE